MEGAVLEVLLGCFVGLMEGAVPETALCTDLQVQLSVKGFVEVVFRTETQGLGHLIGTKVVVNCQT